MFICALDHQHHDHRHAPADFADCQAIRDSRASDDRPLAVIAWIVARALKSQRTRIGTESEMI
jgi:hypothetical protein